MEPSDRLQIRDFIEMLAQFNPRDRITGNEFEVVGVRKHSSMLVEIETEKVEIVADLENQIEDLEREIESLNEKKNELEETADKLATKLCHIESFLNDNIYSDEVAPIAIALKKLITE